VDSGDRDYRRDIGFGGARSISATEGTSGSRGRTACSQSTEANCNEGNADGRGRTMCAYLPKVHREHTTGKLEAEHLDEPRAMLRALPVFETPQAGLVFRMSSICTEGQAAAKVARAMETPRERRVRDAVAGIITVPYDLCLEAIVEVTDLLCWRIRQA